jgi:hypothetical protein
MILFIVVCKSQQKLRFFIKLFLFLSVLSTIFGILVFFWGEPFATIRAWFTQGNPNAQSQFISKGSSLTGLYGLPHEFGYLMASAPILAVSLYLAEQKKIWLVFFIILVCGLFLNAERSALLMNLIVFFIFFSKDKTKRVQKLLLFIFLAASLWTTPYLIRFAGLDTRTVDPAGDIQQGTLKERISDSTIEDIKNRFTWQYYGLKSVLLHPLGGVSGYEYRIAIRKALRSNSAHGIVRSGYDEFPYPHNHYIVAAMDIGVWAWLIVFLAVFLLKRSYAIVIKQLAHDQQKIILFKGVALGLIAAAGNALFHNAGVFSFEFATCSFIAFYLSFQSVAIYQSSKLGYYEES